ncbi:hypothetical protein ITJ44_11805 [Clavibacter sp. VKM Ac-2873]|uniref:hypothetical protein n=1 Tax=Clavibacter sp. VKM Ac-2873 TaxID=2783813 RepID=UPI00188A55CB|nr:hypothetical protein [Clavibacter sp. VKM Ac-2873]MBF4618756.1 hypothetical protein [Clavibacter sp. VKM Ac-2873]
MTSPVSSAEALRRRLRDDPAAARTLDALRRDAYGRPGDDASRVGAHREVRSAAADEADTLAALLAEEQRLVGEGRELLAAEARVDDLTPARPEETADADAGAHAARRLVPPRRRILRPGSIAAVLAGALLVAGLGTASATGLLADGDDRGSAETAATAGPPGTPDPPSGETGPASTTEPPAGMRAQLPAGVTVAALRERADDAWQRVLDRRPDAVRPDVPVERVLGGEEWVRQQAACLGESGVRVQVIGTGDDARLSTDSADDVVRYVCEVRFPAAPRGP